MDKTNRPTSYTYPREAFSQPDPQDGYVYGEESFMQEAENDRLLAEVVTSTTPRIDRKGTFTRTAIVIEEFEGVSIDFIDRHGRLAFRLNAFDVSSEKGELPRCSVDVITLDDRLQGAFHALHKGKRVVDVTPPDGVTVYNVSIRPKKVN